MNVLIDEALERRAASSQRWERDAAARLPRDANLRGADPAGSPRAVSDRVLHERDLVGRRAAAASDAPLARADAIVVFAGGVGESGKAGGGTRGARRARDRSFQGRLREPPDFFDRLHLQFSGSRTDGRARHAAGGAAGGDRPRAARDRHAPERRLHGRDPAGAPRGRRCCWSPRRTTCAARCSRGTRWRPMFA